MSQNSLNQSDEEIDLGYLFQKIKSAAKSILKGILNIIIFFWKHKFPLIGLGIIGIALGLYLAKTAERTYVNELLIQPNYKSTQYVYDKVDAINYKIDDKDSIFLKEVFGKNYKKVKGLEIEPVVDVYSLISESDEIQETFKTLFVENGNVSFFEEDINKIAYERHKVRILTKGNKSSEAVTMQFFNYLKSNSFFEKKNQYIYQKLTEQLEENKLMMQQIDSVIAFVQKSPIPNVSNQGLSFSGSQEVSTLLDRKRSLSTYDLLLLDRLATEEDVIALIDKTPAIMDHSYNFPYRTIPIALVLVYCLVFFFRYVYTKSLQFVNNN